MARTFGVVLALLLASITVALAALLIRTDDARAASRPSIQTLTKLCQHHAEPVRVIRCMWPQRSRAWALRVAECESTASAPERIARRRELGRWARNGKHWGVFQLGPDERAAHGPYRVGGPAVRQIAAALSLYRSRGMQPWTWSRHCWRHTR